jgi:hypothetical protein
VIAFAVGVAFLMGLPVVSLLRVRSRQGGGLLGTAFFLGVLSLALWTHLLLLIRIPVTIVSLLAGPLLACAGAAWRGDRSVFRVTWSRPSIQALPVLLSACFAVLVAVSWTRLGSDGEALYSLKARSIAHYGTFWNPDFTDPARFHPASRRPLLFPCLYADLFMLTGSFEVRPLRLWLAFLHVASLGLLYERARPKMLWLAVFAWIPAYWRQVQGVCTGFPDATLGVVFLLGVDALRREERGLATLSLSAAVLLKQDAWAFPIAIALGTLISDRRRIGTTVRTLVLPLVLVLAWMAIARQFTSGFDFLPGQFEPANLLASPRRWPLALSRLASEIVKPKHWGLFWWAALLGVILGARRIHREDVRWLLIIFFQGVAYVLVWSTYPRDQLRSWMDVQDMRLLLHLLPMMWMWLAIKDRKTREAPDALPAPGLQGAPGPA